MLGWKGFYSNTEELLMRNLMDKNRSTMKIFLPRGNQYPVILPLSIHRVYNIRALLSQRGIFLFPYYIYHPFMMTAFAYEYVWSMNTPA